MKTAAIILAAGKGTRMKSARAKVLHPVAGQPMLCHVVDLVARLGVERACVIVGHQADAVRAVIADRPVDCVLQAEQRGTAHAVLQAEPALRDFAGTILIVSGDTPLLTEATLRRLCDIHQTRAASLTLLTAQVAQPFGYGRIVRDKGRIVRVVEERDATTTERAISEINTGVYAADARFLFAAVAAITPDNSQKEFYLTDVVALAGKRGAPVADALADSDEILGINSRADLARAERIARERINARWMAEGVTMLDPATTRIDAAVTLAPDVTLHPGVTLSGRTRIASGVTLYPCRIDASEIGRNVVVRDHCVIEETVIEPDAVIGPFAHLRPGSIIRRGAHVGNFVEIKKSTLGEGSKANHLTYLGDATIGQRVNIGAGTITCNYDGHEKHPTIIDDDVFVGSDVQLVAPVHIGARSTIAAGTTVVRDVPPGSLVFSRTAQTNKVGWKRKKPAPPSET